MKIEQDRNNSSTADSSGNYHRISFLFFFLFFPSCWCFHSTKKKAITNVDALLSVALPILFVLISGCILGATFSIDSEAYGKWVHNCRPCIITCCIRCRRAFETISQIRLIRCRSLYLSSESVAINRESRLFAFAASSFSILSICPQMILTWHRTHMDWMDRNEEMKR